jgi:hypothetical protein
MGLFDSAADYNEINKSKGGKYVTQGVYLWPFSHADYREAKSGNKAIAFHFFPGNENAEGEKETREKSFWFMEKNGIMMKQKSLFDFREMLFKVFGVKFEEVSSIDDLGQFEKLEGMPQQLNKKIPQGFEVCCTYQYPRDPSTNGKYYLELAFINPASDFEYRTNNPRWNHDSNPNPRNTSSDSAGDQDTSFGTTEGSGFPTEQDDDLPF